MKIFAFQVSPSQGTPPLEHLLNEINNVDLDRRERSLRGETIRVEDIQRRQNGRWYMDLVKIRRKHGPGRAGRGTPIEGFSFSGDEGFGEETAALYDETTKHILIQFNQTGVRHGSIARYFCDFDRENGHSYSFLPRFDQETELRLQRKTVFKKIKFKIAPHVVTEWDRQRGVPLDHAIEMGRASNASSVEIIMAAGKTRNSTLSVRDYLLGPLRRLLAQDPGAVQKIKIVGRDDAESPSEVIDLLGQRLMIEIPIDSGVDLRFPRDDRYAALTQAMLEWGQIFQDQIE